MQMKAKLFIIVLALVVSAANLALAERAEVSLADEVRACHHFKCTEGGDVKCAEVECGPCEQGGGEDWYCTVPPSAQ